MTKVLVFRTCSLVLNTKSWTIWYKFCLIWNLKCSIDQYDVLRWLTSLQNENNRVVNRIVNIFSFSTILVWSPTFFEVFCSMTRKLSLSLFLKYLSQKREFKIMLQFSVFWESWKTVFCSKIVNLSVRNKSNSWKFFESIK